MVTNPPQTLSIPNGVSVTVGVCVGVGVTVRVLVSVFVASRVFVIDLVAVTVGVGVSVPVAVGVPVSVGVGGPTPESVRGTPLPLRLVAPVVLLVACSIGLVIAAGPVFDLVTEAATQLMEPAGYIEAVLGGGG